MAGRDRGYRVGGMGGGWQADGFGRGYGHDYDTGAGTDTDADAGAAPGAAGGAGGKRSGGIGWMSMACFSSAFFRSAATICLWRSAW